MAIKLTRQTSHSCSQRGNRMSNHQLSGVITKVNLWMGHLLRPLLIVALFIAAATLASRLSINQDMTRAQRNSLSPQTHQTLQSLSQPVNAEVVLPTQHLIHYECDHLILPREGRYFLLSLIELKGFHKSPSRQSLWHCKGLRAKHHG